MGEHQYLLSNGQRWTPTGQVRPCPAAMPPHGPGPQDPRLSSPWSRPHLSSGATSAGPGDLPSSPQPCPPPGLRWLAGRLEARPPALPLEQGPSLRGPSCPVARLPSQGAGCCRTPLPPSPVSASACLTSCCQDPGVSCSAQHRAGPRHLLTCEGAGEKVRVQGRGPLNFRDPFAPTLHVGAVAPCRRLVTLRPLPLAQVHLSPGQVAVLPCHIPSPAAGPGHCLISGRGAGGPREDAVTGAGSKLCWQGVNLWPPSEEELATWFLLAFRVAPGLNEPPGPLSGWGQGRGAAGWAGLWGPRPWAGASWVGLCPRLFHGLPGPPWCLQLLPHAWSVLGHRVGRACLPPGSPQCCEPRFPLAGRGLVRAPHSCLLPGVTSQVLSVGSVSPHDPGA